MRTFDFNGLGVALVTPFSATSETVDYERLVFLTERLVNNGANYIVVMGTTAETPTLSSDEKNKIRHTVAEVVNGRIPLVLGFGGNCTRTLCEELKQWDGLHYDAILSVAPFYNKPSQRGLYEHFKAVADTSPVSVLLYNVPGRTGVNLQPATTIALAKNFKKIAGIKEASGNLVQVADILKEAPKDFAVISGDDSLTVEMARLGARGVISVIGNAAPAYWSKLTHLALEGRYDEAKKMEMELQPLLKMIFAEGNPSGIKALMSRMNLCCGALRLPLVEVSTDLKSNISEFLNNYGVKSLQ